MLFELGTTSREASRSGRACPESKLEGPPFPQEERPLFSLFSNALASWTALPRRLRVRDHHVTTSYPSAAIVPSSFPTPMQEPRRFHRRHCRQWCSFRDPSHHRCCHRCPAPTLHPALSVTIAEVVMLGDAGGQRESGFVRGRDLLAGRHSKAGRWEGGRWGGSVDAWQA